MTELQRLRAETDRILAAERAHADAERESLREALRVKHKALERLTYLYESEQDTEALERVERPGWLRVALSRLRLSIPERAADGEKPYRRHATRQNGDCADWCRACEDEARARAALAGEAKACGCTTKRAAPCACGYPTRPGSHEPDFCHVEPSRRES